MRFKMFSEKMNGNSPIEDIVDDIVSTSKNKIGAMKKVKEMASNDKHIDKNIDKIIKIINSIPNNMFGV
jgi:hypothetical protein